MLPRAPDLADVILDCLKSPSATLSCRPSILRPAVIAAAFCVIRHRHQLVKSARSTQVVKKQTEDGSRGSEPVRMDSDFDIEKVLTSYTYSSTEVGLNDAISDFLRQGAGQ